MISIPNLGHAKETPVKAPRLRCKAGQGAKGQKGKARVGGGDAGSQIKIRRHARVCLGDHDGHQRLTGTEAYSDATQRWPHILLTLSFF